MQCAQLIGFLSFICCSDIEEVYQFVFLSCYGEKGMKETVACLNVVRCLKCFLGCRRVALVPRGTGFDAASLQFIIGVRLASYNPYLNPIQRGSLEHWICPIFLEALHYVQSEMRDVTLLFPVLLFCYFRSVCVFPIVGSPFMKYLG